MAKKVVKNKIKKTGKMTLDKLADLVVGNSADIKSLSSAVAANTADIEKLAIMMNNRFNSFEVEVKNEFAKVRVEASENVFSINTSLAHIRQDILQINSNLLKIEERLDKQEKITMMLGADVQALYKEVSKINEKLDKLVEENKKQFGKYDGEIVHIKQRIFSIENKMSLQAVV